MTCDEVELELTTAEDFCPAAREHLVGCEKCRAFEATRRRLLADAALPAPQPELKAKLNGLAARVLAGWTTQSRRRRAVRRVTGFALAACFGAAVASAALLAQLQQAPPQTEVPDVSFAAYEPEPVSSSDTDDELDTFEVSWPSP